MILHNDNYGDIFVKENSFKKLFKLYSDYLAEKKADAQRKKQLFSKYGKKNGTDIYNGIVRIGFSEAMCKAAWGYPDDINTSLGSWGTHEQWCYGDGCYLYFENGRLTSIQK